MVADLRTMDTQLFCDRKVCGVTDCPVTSISVVTFCSSDSVPWSFPQVPCLAKCTIESVTTTMADT